MDIVLLILFIIILLDMKCQASNSFDKEYLSPKKCAYIKGLFTILILLSHYTFYIYPNGEYDGFYNIFREHMGQGIVAMFLFYSGYGIMFSIAKKGSEYIKSIVVKRFPQTFLSFELAVLLYFILQTVLGKRYSLMEFLYGFSGWSRFGNSNWYIFVTLILYLMTAFAFLPFCIKKNKAMLRGGMLFFTLMTMAFMLWLKKAGKPSEWYNSMLCFPAGMWYYLLKDKIEKVLFRSFTTYLTVALCATVLYAYTYQNRGPYSPCELKNYSLWMLTFTGCVLLFSMKISLESPLLKWFGDHVFSIYMLQRLPMIILYESGLMKEYYYEGLIFTIIATALLAICFDKARDKVFSYIWLSRTAKES